MLGPDRLNRRPPIDEHDFFQGKYTAVEPASDGGASAETSAVIEDAAAEGDGEPDEPGDLVAPRIEIEVTIVSLTEEQKGRCQTNLNRPARGAGLRRSSRELTPFGQSG